MKKEKTISLRLNDKTYKRIESIRKQMIEKHAYSEDIELTDSFIIRQAIISLDEKIKYYLFNNEIEYKKKNTK